jgi:hypothetical protein
LINKISPNSTRLLRIYGKFLADVLDNEEDAEMLFMKADQIEEDSTMTKTVIGGDKKGLINLCFMWLCFG